MTTTEHNIWKDRDAAARVREVTGGDETVPVVVIGDRSMVNPSTSEVIDAARIAAPDDVDLRETASRQGRSWGPAASWTLLLVVLWAVLAVWRPTTMWHLMPLLVGGGAAWIAGQDAPVGDRSYTPRVVVAGAAGLAVSLVETFVLASVGLLGGLSLWDAIGASGEAVALGTLGALSAVAVGVARTRRASSGTWSAWWGSHRVASSSEVVMVEGNAYFPRAALAGAELRPSSMTTLCPWKGIARYSHVVVDGVEVRNAAWSYPTPLPFARRIKNRIAFESSITVREGDGTET